MTISQHLMTGACLDLRSHLVSRETARQFRPRLIHGF
jgi:hypothetical protein